jgi:hypothetical protein
MGLHLVTCHPCHLPELVVYVFLVSCLMSFDTRVFLRLASEICFKSLCVFCDQLFHLF